MVDFLRDLSTLNDRSFETLDALSDRFESTDECAKKLSKAESQKYAAMFPGEYNAVEKWAVKEARALNFLRRARGRGAKAIAQRRADYYEKKLESALAAFSAKVNEAKAAGN